jgi:hypothetical protein
VGARGRAATSTAFAQGGFIRTPCASSMWSRRVLTQGVTVEQTKGQNAAEQHQHCEDQYEQKGTETDPGVADCELPHTDGASGSA